MKMKMNIIEQFKNKTSLFLNQLEKRYNEKKIYFFDLKWYFRRPSYAIFTSYNVSVIFTANQVCNIV